MPASGSRSSASPKAEAPARPARSRLTEAPHGARRTHRPPPPCSLRGRRGVLGPGPRGWRSRRPALPQSGPRMSSPPPSTKAEREAAVASAKSAGRARQQPRSARGPRRRRRNRRRVPRVEEAAPGSRHPSRVRALPRDGLETERPDRVSVEENGDRRLGRAALEGRAEDLHLADEAGELLVAPSRDPVVRQDALPQLLLAEARRPPAVEHEEIRASGDRLEGPEPASSRLRHGPGPIEPACARGLLHHPGVLPLEAAHERVASSRRGPRSGPRARGMDSCPRRRRREERARA